MPAQAPPFRRFFLRFLALVCLSLLFPVPARSVGTGEDEPRRDAVGRLLPLSLGSESGRQSWAALFERILSRAGRSYRPTETLSDPLSEYRASGDRRDIPDPRAGGRGNNASDRITNLILGWLLEGDALAREQALLLAEWLAEVPEYQDHAHVQRHSALALCALATPDPVQRERLLDAFLVSFRILQQSRFFNYDDDHWMIGMAGVRPFLRAQGAVHRCSFYLERLLEMGALTPERVAAAGFPFATTDDLLDRADDRLAQFFSWRKVSGDNEPRGWQTDPGGWQQGMLVNFWPYLDSRIPSGRDSTWFHYGQILPYEMLVMRTYSPARFRPLFEARAAETCEWALSIGVDFGFPFSTGLNMVSRRDWFYPTNPALQAPFRTWTEQQREDNGESVYCLVPCLSFVRDLAEYRRQAWLLHARTSSFSDFEGEVSFPMLLGIDEFRRRRATR
jgi:hypothetical protein